eukprot:12493478-Prorocentrum_lima.AAC.1
MHEGHRGPGAGNPQRHRHIDKGFKLFGQSKEIRTLAVTNSQKPHVPGPMSSQSARARRILAPQSIAWCSTTTRTTRCRSCHPLARRGRGCLYVTFCKWHVRLEPFSKRLI